MVGCIDSPQHYDNIRRYAYGVNIQFLAYHDCRDHVRRDGVPETVAVADGEAPDCRPSQQSLHLSLSTSMLRMRRAEEARLSELYLEKSRCWVRIE